MSSSPDADSLNHSPGPGLLEAGWFLDHTTSPLIPLLLLLAATFTLGFIWGHGVATLAPSPRPCVVHINGVGAQRRKQQQQQKYDDDDDDNDAQVWTLESAAQDAGEATPWPRPQEPAPDRTGRSRHRTMPTPPPLPSFFRDIPSPPPFEQLSIRSPLGSEVRDASAPPASGDRGGGSQAPWLGTTIRKRPGRCVVKFQRPLSS